jgi:uncharacterized repeat protein (TIGR01451 family)
LESGVSFSFAGANPAAPFVPQDALPGKSNYLRGNRPEHWQTDVPHYAKVLRENIYPGVNLVYYNSQRQLEYDFIVAPHADPKQIRWNIAGAKSIRLDANGDLVINTPAGDIRQHKPFAYQEIKGQRRAIAAGYEVQGSRFKVQGSRLVSFVLGEYDRTRPLVIDPVLSYSTFLGGSGTDFGKTIAVDANGNMYVAGETNSANFPLTGGVQGTLGGNSDVFVTKLNPAGDAIIYSTFIGGEFGDEGNGIFVDAAGNAYVTGRTSSEDFPVTPTSFQPVYRGGDFDGFALKLNAAGNALTYSTYLGGNDNDAAIGLTVDGSGFAYVTGGTKSNDFPAFNAFQPNLGGETDAWLTKLNTGGTSIVYSTFIGGISTERGSAVAFDNSGNVYVAGLTRSDDFPTINASQNTFAGVFDAFLIKFNPAGNQALFSTYLGGAGDDRSFGLAVDTASGDAYVTGQAGNGFPTLNALFPTYGGGPADVFIAKFDTGGARQFSTYLGGSSDDKASGVALRNGNLYVAGYTASTNFPTLAPAQANNAGLYDAFVTKLNTAGGALGYSTYLGGAGNDSFNGQNLTYTGNIAVDATGAAYITGSTASANFPTVNPLRPVYGGGTSDAYVAKLTETPDFVVNVTPAARAVTAGGSTTYAVTVTPVNGFNGTVNLNLTGLPAEAAFSFNPSSLVVNNVSTAASTLTVNTSAATPLGSSNLTISGASGNLTRTANATLTVSAPANANLTLTDTDSPDPCIVNTNLAYRLFVANSGPAAANNVVLTTAAPPNTTFVSVAATQGACTGTTSVTCNLGAINANANAAVTYTLRPAQAGTLNHSASVLADNAVMQTASTSTTVINAASGPTMLDPNLTVRAVTAGLNQPTSMAFLRNNDFLILEKASGQVHRIVNGVPVGPPALDLAVNSASERGLLGIALHPDFASNNFVYLYWSQRNSANLFGADSADISDTPTLGNRIDRFIWTGSSLTFDRNIAQFRAFQADAGQPVRGNHNGGVIRFGPDGKLYAIVGDVGRRGLLQNITSGGPVPDDQFGGPEPDNAHFTGVIVRLNDDGTAPTDNPFFNAQTNLTGEAAANIKKIYSYGVRNGFGMAFDPYTGQLWNEENGDDAFDEINRVRPGMNSGWIQTIGPVSRVAQYRDIEVSRAGGLQQIRWPAENIATTPEQALARLYSLPGSQFYDPEFSWKFAVALAPIGFVNGNGLGPNYAGDMFVGEGRSTLLGGFLFRMKLSSDRNSFAFSDSRLNDKVADNLDKFDLTESESLLIGRDFGITTDIQTGPNGNLFVVSNTNGAVYEISAVAPQVYTATLNAAQEVPANNSTATGQATLTQYPDGTGRLSLYFSGLTSAQLAAHIHGPAAPGVNAPVIINLPTGSFSDLQISLTSAQVQSLQAGLLYINVHSVNFPGGEIRGQFGAAGGVSNPIDLNSFFVRQHYLDFLNREPDAPGLAYWTEQLSVCGTGASCLTRRRADVSAAFFVEQEFQNSGYFVYLAHRAALGPQPTFAQYLTDRNQVGTGAEADKTAFLASFTQRQEFLTKYPATMSGPAFITALLNNTQTATGVNLNDLSNVMLDDFLLFGSRARLLRIVIEDARLRSAEYNRAFVLAQYFGYLRRDADTGGYAFWLNVLNANPNNFRGMVCAFITSQEYQQRFSPVFTRANSDCGGISSPVSVSLR